MYQKPINIPSVVRTRPHRNRGHLIGLQFNRPLDRRYDIARPSWRTKIRTTLSDVLTMNAQSSARSTNKCLGDKKFNDKKRYCLTIKWQYPEDIVTTPIKAPHSSQIKTEVKECPTATYWGHVYKPQNRITQGMQNTNLNTVTYLLIIFCKSLTKASEELWPAPHRCSPVV